MTFPEALQALDIEATADLLSGFEAFSADLYEQNKTTNLTRIAPDECWVRHFIDSLLFHDLIPPGSSVLDIGCGPGFPAWPLAFARPDLKVTAMDSNHKMLGFLARHPLSNLNIECMRAEDFTKAGRFDVVTGRAVAPLSIQLELSMRPCREKGLVIPMRTASDKDEIERLKDVLCLHLERIVERELPLVAAKRVFPIYRKAGLTPKGYPRPWSQIKSKPL